MKESAEQSAALFLLRKNFGRNFTDFADQRIRCRDCGFFRNGSRLACAKDTFQVVEGVRVFETLPIKTVGEHHTGFIVLIGEGEQTL